jgi:hypothetical protein
MPKKMIFSPKKIVFLPEEMSFSPEKIIFAPREMSFVVSGSLATRSLLTLFCLLTFYF